MLKGKIATKISKRTVQVFIILLFIFIIIFVYEK